MNGETINFVEGGSDEGLTNETASNRLENFKKRLNIEKMSAEAGALKSEIVESIGVVATDIAAGYPVAALGLITMISGFLGLAASPVLAYATGSQEMAGEMLRGSLANIDAGAVFTLATPVSMIAAEMKELISAALETKGQK